METELLLFLYFCFDNLKDLRDRACDIVNMSMTFLSELVRKKVRGFHVIYVYFRKLTNTM
jgi:hypothetical protein